MKVTGATKKKRRGKKKMSDTKSNYWLRLSYFIWTWFDVFLFPRLRLGFFLSEFRLLRVVDKIEWNRKMRMGRVAVWHSVNGGLQTKYQRKNERIPFGPEKGVTCAKRASVMLLFRFSPRARASHWIMRHPWPLIASRNSTHIHISNRSRRKSENSNLLCERSSQRPTRHRRCNHNNR